MCSFHFQNGLIDGDSVNNGRAHKFAESLLNRFSLCSTIYIKGSMRTFLREPYSRNRENTTTKKKTKKESQYFKYIILLKSEQNSIITFGYLWLTH